MELSDIFAERSSVYAEAHMQMDELVGIYFGDLPREFGDLFHPDMHVYVVNMIRLAWDDLAAMSGKVFPIYVEPENDSAAARNRAEKLEKIAYGYNEAGRIVGGISMNLLMKVISWWLVGVGNAVFMVLPSYDHKTPFFTFRDPRTYYPPIGWTPYTQAAASDALFAYPMPVAELKARYPDKAGEISRTRARVFAPGSGPGSEDSAVVFVGEYYHRDTWQVAILEDRTVILERSDDGDPGHPGVVPVVPVGLYAPNMAKGRSLFADQVSIQAAISRMFSQKLEFYDRTLYPIIFHTPLEGKTIRIGPYATNVYDTTVPGVTPRADVIAPAQNVDADQTMAFAIGLTRMLNRNPETMQGFGQADSAKALSELKAAVGQTIEQVLWPPLLEALPRLYALAATIDVRLWGDLQKRATGHRKNAAFSVTYRPNVDLRGHENDFRVEPGIGLAGYLGQLEIMQRVGAEMLSEDTALEQMPDIRNPQEEKRRIQGMRVEKLMFADLAGKAQMGLLIPGALAEIRRRVLASGEDLFDVIESMEREGRLYVAPPPAAPEVAGAAPGPEVPPIELLRGGF